MTCAGKYPFTAKWMRIKYDFEPETGFDSTRAGRGRLCCASPGGAPGYYEVHYRPDLLSRFALYRSFPINKKGYRSYPCTTTILLHLGERGNSLFMSGFDP